jgi:hypothetical protein
MITWEELGERWDALETLKRNFLRDRGWEYSSNHPGSLWLFSKIIGRKLYVCDQTTAIALEEGTADELLDT